MRCHFISTKTTIIKKKKTTHTHKITSVGKDEEELEPSYTGGGKVHGTATM